MSRWKAAAIHLSISLTVLLTLAALLSATWYPPEYVPFVGGIALLGIVAAVDACIGPLLTLIVFDTKKPNLRFDLGVIVLIQLAALGYGIFVLFDSRPVFLVFKGDGFGLMTAPEISRDFLAATRRDGFKTLPVDGPKLAAARVPLDTREQSLMMTGRQFGFGLQHFPQFYVPYADAVPEVLEAARPAAGLVAGDSEADRRLAAWCKDHRRNPAEVKVLPVTAKRGQGLAVLDGKTAAVLDLLAVDVGAAPGPSGPARQTPTAGSV